MAMPVIDTNLTRAFHALGDPVRAGIVEHLSEHGEATVNELASQFPITIQAVSRHIKVLQTAGLVSQRRDGRRRPVRLERGEVESAGSWIAARLAHLEARYERLDDVLADVLDDLRRRNSP